MEISATNWLAHFLPSDKANESPMSKYSSSKNAISTTISLVNTTIISGFNSGEKGIKRDYFGREKNPETGLFMGEIKMEELTISERSQPRKKLKSVHHNSGPQNKNKNKKSRRSRRRKFYAQQPEYYLDYWSGTYKQHIFSSQTPNQEYLYYREDLQNYYRTLYENCYIS